MRIIMKFGVRFGFFLSIVFWAFFSSIPLHAGWSDWITSTFALTHRFFDQITHVMAHRASQQLIVMAGMGHTQHVRDLLRVPGIEVNARTAHVDGGNTALSNAVCLGKHEIVALLLADARLHVNQKVSGGRNVLMWAICCNQQEIVKQLLEHPAIEVNHHEDATGNTALMLAVQRSQREIVRILLNKPELAIEAINAEGKTALMFAVEKNDLEIVHMLSQHEEEIMVKPACSS